MMDSTLIADPVAFARVCLGHKIWRGQARILRGVASNRQTAVKACHGSSKTFTAAEALLWWLTRFDDGIVVTTAPTWFQVENLLWSEVHKAIATSRIAFPKPSLTELTISPGNYAVGLSTNDTVRFQGFHGKHLLFILDEAPGVRPGIWEAIEGAQSGGDVRILALGNPTLVSNPFHDAFTRHRGAWDLQTISAFDTPNLRGLTHDDLMALPDDELDRAVAPFLVTRRWVREKALKWGTTNPLYQARVLGEFPAQADDALYSLAWLERAGAAGKVDDAEPVRAGVDVAGPGEDETVVCVRQGATIIAIEAFPDSDARGRVIAMLAPYRDRLENVNVDSVGMGYYFAQSLRDAGLNVSEVNAGEASSDREKYANLKAEMYWGLRERLSDGDLYGLTDELAVAQLAGVKYAYNARGQLVIESKDDARRRGISSPDRAEAVILAFADNGRGLNFY